MREAYKPTMREAYNAGGLQCGRPYAGGVSKSRAHFWSQERRDSRMFPRRMLQVLQCLVCGYDVTKVR